MKYHWRNTLAAKTHGHTKEEIVDFPSVMPPTPHKESHQSGGSDVLTPGGIGAWTKEEVLSADTRTLLRLAANATPSDAYDALMLRIVLADKARITLTVKDTSGNPAKQMEISSTRFVDEQGTPVGAIYTDDRGIATGYIAPGSATLQLKNYADILDFSETFTVVAGQSYAKAWTIARRSFLKMLTSANYKFSANVKSVDVTAVGGGGGGGEYRNVSMGTIGWNAGGGGYCMVRSGIVPVPKSTYPAVVGSGGAGNEWAADSGMADASFAGRPGGNSSFMSVSANGGQGGTSTTSGGGSGNGQGGGYNAAFGVAGSVQGYSTETETVLYGGGGGGYWAANDTSHFGTPAGFGGICSGNGATLGDMNGKDGFGGGGGGGKARGSGGGWAPFYSSAGGAGCVVIRIHL